MFCSNCGKKILSGDQFCPFCGERVIRKKIVIDENASLESLLKRGMMLLEDGDFYSADECFNRVLSLDPENFDGYFGKEMAKHGLKYKDDFYEYFKKLFCSNNVEYVKACDEDEKHIEEMVTQYSIDYYLDKKTIEEKYLFDRTVKVQKTVRQNEKRLIEEEFSKDNILARIERYANEDEKNKIEEIFQEYDRRIELAKENDEKEKQDVNNQYKSHLEKTDLEIKKLYDDAKEKREHDYSVSIDALDNSNDIESLKHVEVSFGRMKDYKDSAEFQIKVGEKISRLEAELLAKNKRRKIIIIATAAIMIISVFAYSQYYTNVIVPKRKYNDATKLLNEGKYAAAITAFSELGTYEDSEEMLNEAYYQKACYHLANNQYSESIEIFNKLADYKESKANLIDAKYKMAVNYYNSKSIDKAIELFTELKEYKDSENYIDRINEEYILLKDFSGKQLSEIKQFLSENNLKYYLKKKNMSTLDKILSVEPSPGYIKRDTTVVVQVSLGNVSLKDYKGDGNGKEIFKVKVNKAGDKVRVRTSPVVLADLSNKVANLSEGSVQSVYEILEDGGYTWYRIGNRRWIATESGWVSIIK